MGLARLRLSTRLMEQLLAIPEGHRIESWGVGTDEVEVWIAGPDLPEPREDGSLILVSATVEGDLCEGCGRYRDNCRMRFSW